MSVCIMGGWKGVPLTGRSPMKGLGPPWRLCPLVAVVVGVCAMGCATVGLERCTSCSSSSLMLKDPSSLSDV